MGSLLIAPSIQSIQKPPTRVPLQTIQITGGSGPYVSAWYARHPREKAVVLLLHGVRANRLSMVRRAEFLFEARYSVLLPDFQAHGESPGEYITFGYKEALDARAMVAYLRQQNAEVKIGVIGSSLGGASVLLGKQPFGVDAVILEAVYPDLEKAIENRLVIRLGAWGRYLVPLLSWQVEPRLGFASGDLRPVSGASALGAPVLIIAGEQDRRTTLKDSRQIYEAAVQPKELWVIKRAAHVDFHRFSGKSYEDRVLAFFGRYLKAE